MEIPEDFKKLLKKSPLAIVIVVIIAILAIGEHFEEFDALKAKLAGGIIKGLEIDWEKKQILLTDWLAILILLSIAAIVILGVLLWRAVVISIRPTAALQQRLKMATHSLNETMAAASQIRDQVFPPTEEPSRNIVHCEGTYLIHKNFDLEARIHYKIAATNRPLHFMETDIWVEDEADEMEFFDEIKFKIADGKNAPIPYLPSLNGVHHKSGIFYFLPALDPREAKPRDVVVSYFWPGGLKKLARDNAEDYVWNMKSAENIPLAVYRFYIEDGTDKNLHCRITGNAGGTQTVKDKITHAERGWTGWEYKLEDVPGGRYKVTLELLRP